MGCSQLGGEPRRVHDAGGRQRRVRTAAVTAAGEAVYLGVDVGATKIAFGLVTPDGRH